MKQEEVTVQIKVNNYNDNYFLLSGKRELCLIHKDDCTVVVPSVEQQEGEVKGFCIKRTPENAEVLNKCGGKINSAKDAFFDNDGYLHFNFTTSLIEIWDEPLKGFTLIYTISEFFEKVGYTPEPERTPIGTYEGQPIYEDTKAWFVDLLTFKIFIPLTVKLNYWAVETEFQSKVYITPEEANARLKLEVSNKAMDYPISITSRQYTEGFDSMHEIAIKEVEKQFNVIYLTPNTESKMSTKVKGEFNGLCNRTACQSPNEVKWYNHSTRLYYCTECAHLLNKVNYSEAQRLFGHQLCTEGKQP